VEDEDFTTIKYAKAETEECINTPYLMRAAMKLYELELGLFETKEVGVVENPVKVVSKTNKKKRYPSIQYVAGNGIVTNICSGEIPKNK
jgi:hypothetical protein